MIAKIVFSKLIGTISRIVTAETAATAPFLPFLGGFGRSGRVWSGFSRRVPGVPCELRGDLGCGLGQPQRPWRGMYGGGAAWDS